MTARAAALLVASAAVIVYLGPKTCIHRAGFYPPETFALKATQTLNTAQVQYQSQYGRFARALAELGPSGANLISSDLASGEKRGYRFNLAATSDGYNIPSRPGCIWQNRLAHLLL